MKTNKIENTKKLTAYHCSTSGETRVERWEQEIELKDTERNIQSYVPLRIWKPSIKCTILLLYFFNNTHTYYVVLSASLKKKKKRNTEQILYRFSSATARFQISQSVDFNAPALEWRAKSEHRPQLIQPVLQSGRCHRRQSVRSVSVKFCTPLIPIMQCWYITGFFFENNYKN